MNSPTDEQLPAAHGARHGWAMGIGLVAVVILVVVVFALPGFVAAEISKHSNTFFSLNGDVEWSADGFINSEDPDLPRVELLPLSPTSWLMRHSQSIRRFYSWEYRIDGGVNVDPEI